MTTHDLNLATEEPLKSSARLVHFTEILLAGAIGAASARVMVASVVEEESPGIDEVMNMLDEASQVIAYSRQLEQILHDTSVPSRPASACAE